MQSKKYADNWEHVSFWTTKHHSLHGTQEYASEVPGEGHVGQSRVRSLEETRIETGYDIEHKRRGGEEWNMIEREERMGVTVLRLAHGKANALDLELMTRLDQELQNLSDAGSVILTGSGSIFSAGVDLYRLIKEDSAYLTAFIPQLTQLLERLFTFPRPLIAAVNGHAIAGGCILIQCADYRLLSKGGSRVGVPELLVGVPFPALAMEIVRFAVPRQHIQKLVYRGLTVPPDEALSHGFVDEICSPDALLDRALSVASQLAAVPVQTFTITKNQLRRDAIDRWKKNAHDDNRIERVWASEQTKNRIETYLKQTIGQKK